MKKIIICLTIILSAIFIFSACGSSNVSADDFTLEVTTNKTNYAIGEEIKISSVLKNGSGKICKILKSDNLISVRLIEEGDSTDFIVPSIGITYLMGTEFNYDTSFTKDIAGEYTVYVIASFILNGKNINIKNDTLKISVN